MILVKYVITIWLLNTSSDVTTKLSFKCESLIINATCVPRKYVQRTKTRGKGIHDVNYPSFVSFSLLSDKLQESRYDTQKKYHTTALWVNVDKSRTK